MKDGPSQFRLIRYWLSIEIAIRAKHGFLLVEYGDHSARSAVDPIPFCNLIFSFGVEGKRNLSSSSFLIPFFGLLAFQYWAREAPSTCTHSPRLSYLHWELTWTPPSHSPYPSLSKLCDTYAEAVSLLGSIGISLAIITCPSRLLYLYSAWALGNGHFLEMEQTCQKWASLPFHVNSRGVIYWCLDGPLKRNMWSCRSVLCFETETTYMPWISPTNVSSWWSFRLLDFSFSSISFILEP